MKARIILLSFLLIVFSAALFSQAPEWQWATQAGGSGNDAGNGIAIDENGNNYVTGNFIYNVTFGSFILTSNGVNDIFVTKLDSDGNFIWAAQSSGNDWITSLGIAIDNNGNSYVTGSFIGTINFGLYSITTNGEHDIFVAKLDSDGNWLWAAHAGGNGIDAAVAISTNDYGSSYISGFFEDTANFGSYTLTSSGGRDTFIAKLDNDGNWLWVENVGESWSFPAICSDSDGNSYVTSDFGGTMTFGSYTLTGNGNDNIYVAKIDANDNWLWAIQAGESEQIIGTSIAVGDNGNSYVTASFEETATFGSYALTSNGNEDIFVAKLDTNGNWLWVVQAGGSHRDNSNGITTDNNGNSYVTGNFYETISFGPYNLTSSGGYDIFVAKIDANGNWLWAIQAGGEDRDYEDNALDVTVDNYGNSYVTGYFNYIVTFGSYTLTNSIGNKDIFIAKLGNETSVGNETITMNNKLSNFPNPFNPRTTISFSIQDDSQVELSIFNITGQKVKILAQNEFTKGSHSIIWNGDDDFGNSFSSGVYLYKLNVNGKTEAVKKCLLLK